jgi:DNA-binding MarR family transcriptional regulator
MRTAELASLAHQIRSLTTICAKLMAHHLEHHLAQYWPGMSGPQYGVLRILECNPSTIRELSERMLLAPSTLVPIVDRLESESLVVRGKDPEDRRRTPLMLTEQARQLLVRVPTVDAQNHLGQALQAMGVEKSRQLSLLLQELVANLANDHGIVDRIVTLSTHASEASEGASNDSHSSESQAPVVK